MSQDLLNIKISDFRAILNADIKLNGITVIAGENGCGKSTISRLIYKTIKTAIDYDKIIKNSYSSKLSRMYKNLYNLTREIKTQFRYRDKNNVGRIHSSQLRGSSIDEIKEVMLDYIQYLQRFIMNEYNLSQSILFDENKDKQEGLFLIRIAGILRDVLEDKKVPYYKDLTVKDKESNADYVLYLLESLKVKVEELYANTQNDIEIRPLHYFNDELSKYLDKSIVKSFELNEFDHPITDWENKTLRSPYTIEECFYIDTPMALNVEYSDIEHWDDLNSAIRDNGNFDGKSDLFINKIISGQVYFTEEDFDEGFKYKRTDGAEFDLNECATGIKSFGILQMLLNNGVLHKNSLLIIDEPEAHLHPQWIVEYARVIIWLNKKFGVKFLIATHNPDMVSALKYISLKEIKDSAVSFYLAERSRSRYNYNYKHLGMNIDRIFTSFNRALDKINLYGIDLD